MWNEFFERVLAVEAPGGPADRLSVIVPSIVRPGERFAVKLAALDVHGYPSVECDASVRPLPGPARGPGQVLVFQEGKPAVGRLADLCLPQEGLSRLAFEMDGREFLSNPVRCDASATERIFWGDPHVHTVLSNCVVDRCRSIDFAHVCGRYVTGLDWISVADHVSGGRSDRGKWKTQRAAAEAFNDPPCYVTLLGYEASLKGGLGGDNNVYFPGDAEAYVDVWDQGDLRDLSEGLGDQDCLIVPHHTARAIKHGELSDELYLGRERMPVVEIYSKWGASEYLGNPNALNEPHDGPGYVQDFLAAGYPFGFIGGTDTHATMPSGWGEESEHVDRMPAFTALRARECSRSALYTNLRRRNCYATSGERILVDVSIAGAPMGTEVSWPDAARPRTVTASIAVESEITRVEVVRNNENVYSEEGGGWQMELSWTDEQPLGQVAFDPRGAFERPFVYYYLRVNCATGAQAWTSPVWLTL